MSAGSEVRAPLFAYTDETGNTGLNLFDEGQPFFWTGTLLAVTDLDRLDPAIHQACLSRVGRSELHANELGFSGIEKIAGKLQQLLFRYRAQFIFTRLEKTHLAGTKFVDTLLDSGINQAVSNIHYGVRIHHLYLAYVIVTLLDAHDREEFWEAYARADAKAFVRILRRVEGRIESNVSDPRTRQLLLDAITWAEAHPEPLLEGTRSDLDSPNVVALTLLIHTLHEMNRSVGLSVGTFIHDEQKQFAKCLQLAYDVNKAYTSRKGNSPFALMIDLQEMNTFGGNFRTASSKTSFGLQILDVALWLVKRFVDDPGAVHGKCRELAEYITKGASISNFTQHGLAEQVFTSLIALEKMPVTPDQDRKARELVAEFEEHRLARMRGLAP